MHKEIQVTSYLRFQTARTQKTKPTVQGLVITIKYLQKQQAFSIRMIQQLRNRTFKTRALKLLITSSTALLTVQISGEMRLMHHLRSRLILKTRVQVLISHIRRKVMILKASFLLKRLSTYHLEVWTQENAISTKVRKYLAQERI